jgi:gamma-glutamyltranspeptidase/glutathione hydrolase
VDWYLSRGKTLLGEGLDPAVVPGAVHAALTVREKWGTLRFEDVALPAIDYAERGFPLRVSTARAIVNEKPLFDKWPGNQKNWYRPDGTGRSQYERAYGPSRVPFRVSVSRRTG